MTSDILEQIVDDYLQHRGYFTIHNVKFRPDESNAEYDSQADCVHSDIDVMGFNPTEPDPYKRVMAVSCKSWQDGFPASRWVGYLEKGELFHNVPAWKKFREISREKWGEAFSKKILEKTGQHHFTHVTAVLYLKGSKEPWEQCELFQRCNKGNPVQIWTLSEMLDDIHGALGTTPTFSDVGRLLQVMKAAKWSPGAE